MISLLRIRSVFVVILALGLFVMAARSVTDPDVWWHLRTGQLMVQTHSVFHTDPYSFTRFGQPWVDHEWLSQIVIFALYQAAGWGGLITGFGAIIAAALVLMFLRSPGRPYIAGVMTVWGALASLPSWGVRPQMLTFLLASMFLLILERSEDQPHLLWWTPALMLLWVNFHGGYAVGIALMVLFLAGEFLDTAFGFRTWSQVRGRFKILAFAIVVCIAVVLLNPNGVRMYRYPLETVGLRALQNYIQEWSSPDFHQYKYLVTLFMMLATLALAAVSPRRFRARELLLLCVTTYAAVRSVRHIPIYVLVAVPILSAQLQACLQGGGLARRLEAGQKSPTRSQALVNAILLAGFLLFTVARLGYVVGRQSAVEAEKFPAAAVTFVRTQRPAGPILNHYNWGGYFIWKLYPEYQVYIDGRTDLYGDSLMNEFDSTYYVKGKFWQQPLQKWGIQTIILPPDAPLVTALQTAPGWKRLYADPQAVVLSKVP